MNDTQRETNGRSESITSQNIGTASYKRAVTPRITRSQTTSIGTARCETVASSQTQGLIRVRLIPVSAPKGEQNTAV